MSSSSSSSPSTNPRSSSVFSSDSATLADFELDFDRMYFEVPEIKQVFADFARDMAHVAECTQFFDSSSELQHRFITGRRELLH
jgi:hypothetical protein